MKTGKINDSGNSHPVFGGRRIPVLGLLALAVLLIFTGCSRNGDATEKSNANNERPPVAVDVAVAAAGNLMQSIDVTGALKPKFEVDVKSEVSGVVKKVHVTQWISVQKGAPLAQIDTREQEALAQRVQAALESSRATLMQALVARSRAGRELDRMVKLKEAGLATQQSLDDARTEKDAAVARVEAAHAGLRAAEAELTQVRTHLGKGLLTAPISGVISERRVNVGDLVGEPGAGVPLFHIVDNRILELTVTVPSSAMAALRRGQTLEFTTDAWPDRIFSGTVMFINPAVSEADRSVRVVADVDNASFALKGGLFVKGRILTGMRGNVICVPRTALSGWNMGDGKARLMIVRDNRAQVRDVITGQAGTGGVEIRQGLTPGETYVVKGGFNVRNGDRIFIATLKKG